MPRQQEEEDGLLDKLASKVGGSLGEPGVRGRGGKCGTHESALGAHTGRSCLCPLSHTEDPALTFSCWTDIFSALPIQSPASPRIC